MTPARRCHLAVLVGLLFFAAVAQAFSIRDAGIQLLDGVYRMDARIDFEFSEEALEALDNGVPLTVVVEIRTEAADAWFWQRPLADHELRYEVRYHPLAGLYSVMDLDAGLQERFATREAAFSMLGTLRNLKVVSERRLQDGVEYRVMLRAFLDIESLPLPLRPRAYISRGWRLSTGWDRWRLPR